MENNNVNNIDDNSQKEKKKITITSFFTSINEEKKERTENSNNKNKEDNVIQTSPLNNEMNNNKSIKNSEKNTNMLKMFEEMKSNYETNKKTNEESKINVQNTNNNKQISNIKDNINQKENKNENIEFKNNKSEFDRKYIKEDNNQFKVLIKLIENNTFYIGHLILKNYIISFIPNSFSKALFDEKSEKNPNFYEFSLFQLDKIKVFNVNFITLKLKDRRILNFSCEYCKQLENILQQLRYPNNLMLFYHYAYYYKKNNKINYKINGWNIYDIEIEFCRQNLNFEKYSFTDENIHYNLCKTYPKKLIIPSKFKEFNLSQLATYRSKNRFPVLTYYYSKKESCIFRSSQCLSGKKSKTSNLEIEYFKCITENKKILNIYDLRSKAAAMVNILKGGGSDDVNLYDNCRLEFCDLENIHIIRNAYKKFMEDPENKDWIKFISQLIYTTNKICNSIYKGEHVLIHCSDGWDRTTQICCLVQLILDPFYRSLNGFCILIEKDFISFGHQFALRNGCYTLKKKNDFSPIFIQFLYCVYQLIIQFPTAFEFNENFLIFLGTEIYNNKYGSFLFNSEHDLNINHGKELTVSIWSEVFENKYKFYNHYYVECNEKLVPKYEIEFMNNWNNFKNYYERIGGYFRNNSFVYKNESLIQESNEKGKILEEIYNLLNSKGLTNLLSKNTKDYISKYKSET